MKLSKQSKFDFEYIYSMKKTNKMHGSQKYLSKDNKIVNKNHKSNIIIKDYIVKENAPIKVTLKKDTNLSQNPYMVKHIDKSEKKYKKRIVSPDNKSIISNLKNKNKTISNKDKKTKEIIKDNIPEQKSLTKNNIAPNISISDIRRELNNLKNFMILSRLTDKNTKINNAINTNNIKTSENLSEEEKRNTYEKKNIKKLDIYLQNFIYNKPIKGNNLNNNYSILSKNSDNNSKLVLYTESNGWGGMSSDNILQNFNKNNKNENIYKKRKIKISKSTNALKTVNNKTSRTEDIIKVNKKNTNNISNLKTYLKNRPKMLFSHRGNTGPLKVKNYNNNSFNITNNNYKYIYLSPRKEIIYNNTNANMDDIEIKLKDLILYEERLNDIYIALNNKHIFDGEASNECVEFFKFYFNSSLIYKFPLFFNETNNVIIKSAVNLNLFIIIITYHLSSSPVLIKKLINELKNIFIISKNNYYLFIRKIQLYYGEKYTKKNEIYFKDFNNILIQNGLINYNENQIVKFINKNCFEIVKNINNIINFYKSTENKYFLDFFEIFSLISKLNEIDIHNYFYEHLYSISSKFTPKPKYNPIKKSESFNMVKSNININDNKNKENINNKDKELEIKAILKYHKNKIPPPFLKKPNEKKYSLILNLEEVFIHINSDGNFSISIRPGFFSFLKEIKPFYELISFTNESKYSSDNIIKQIESKNKYFDYNLYREHLSFDGKEFFKDISKLGRDIKKIIIIDNINNNYKLNPENVIHITPYINESLENDNILCELKKLLILIYKSGYEDIRIGIKKHNITIIKDKDNNKEIKK